MRGGIARGRSQGLEAGEFLAIPESRFQDKEAQKKEGGGWEVELAM